MASPRHIARIPDLRLAPLGREHADATYRWVCDPEVADNIGLGREPSLEKTLDWIEESARDPKLAARAILRADQHIGNVVLDRIDRHLDAARLSIYLGEERFRSHGAGTWAVYLALREGFEELLLHKIWLTVHARNHRGLNAYCRLGFAIEGVLRDEFILRGERIDRFSMGLLRSEFRGICVSG